MKRKTEIVRVGKGPRDSRSGGPRAAAGVYELVLYISGATQHSTLALANVKSVAEKYLQGRYRLSVVDLFQQPEQAKAQDVIAVPMLIKTLPLPPRRMVGELSSEDRILVGLDLVPPAPSLEQADDHDGHP